MKRSSEFKDAMSLVPTSVGILWMDLISGDKVGCTISSFISVSVEMAKEKIAFVLRDQSRTTSYLRKTEYFHISILGEKQVDIARLFASSFPVPLLNEELLNFPNWESSALCNFRLSVSQIQPVNDTLIVTADVLNYSFNANIKPLVYASRKFVPLSI